MKKKVLILLFLLSCSLGYATDSGDKKSNIEKSLNDLEKKLVCGGFHNDHRSDDFDFKMIILLKEESLYKFEYEEKNEKYTFFIPEDTVITKIDGKYFIRFYLEKAECINNEVRKIIRPYTFVELEKENSKFRLNTDNLEFVLSFLSSEESNVENMILRFRKRLLDNNKVFIEEQRDIEFEKKLKLEEVKSGGK